MKINNKDLKELQRIQKSIPKELSERLIVKRMITPATAQALELGLRDKNLSDEFKERLRIVKESGLFHQKEETVNKSVEKKIDAYLTEQIRRSIAAGRLSNNTENHAKSIKGL